MHKEGRTDWKQAELQFHQSGCWVVGCVTGCRSTVTPSICELEGAQACKKTQNAKIFTQDTQEWSDHLCYMWRLTAFPGMSLCHCPPSRLPLHHRDLLIILQFTVKSQCAWSRRAVTDTLGAARNLTLPRWAAAEDHGPAVAAQAPQRLPAPVDLHQSHCHCRSLPPPPSFLLPGCSDAAPAWPATLLSPRVGGERAPSTSAHWGKRGETEGQLGGE